MAPRNATTTSRGRTYTWRDETYWSVTTIIGNGLPKPALLPWGIKSVAVAAVSEVDRLQAMVRASGDDPCPCSGRCHDEKARCAPSCEALVSVVGWLKGSPYRQRDKAADLGSLVHARIESLILGQPEPSAPPVARGFLEAFDAFVRDWHPTFEAAEFTVYNRGEHYAGTGDWLARIPGHGLVLGDQKTGKSIYSDVCLQLAAYRYAEFIGLPDGTEAPMPAADECMALHLRGDGTYALVPVDAGPEAFLSFKYVREVFRFTEDLAKRALGEPLTPEGQEAVA